MLRPYKGNYLYPAKKDMYERVGLMESFKVFTTGDIKTYNATYGIGHAGKPCIPAYFDRVEGYKPISGIITDADSALKFERSNRAEYSILGDFFIIADIILKVDSVTGKALMDKSKINIFVPASYQYISDADKCDAGDYLVCSRLSPRADGLGDGINPNLYQGYIEAILSHFEKLPVIEGRADFNLARLRG